MKKNQIVKITTPFITLGQLVKLMHLVSTGGEVKVYLTINTPIVNGEKDMRRGRKLYPGDIIDFPSLTVQIEK